MEEVNKKEFKEIKIISLLAISVLFFLSLASYDPLDVSFHTTSPNIPPNNLIGIIGTWLGFFCFFTFGFSSFIIPFATFLWAVHLSLNKKVTLLKLLVLFLLLFSLSSVLEILPILFLKTQAQNFNIVSPGGALSFKVTKLLIIKYLGEKGTLVLMFAFLIISFMQLTNLKLIKTISWLSGFFKKLSSRQKDRAEKTTYTLYPRQKKQKKKEPLKKTKKTKESTPAPFRGYLLPDFKILEEPPHKKDGPAEDLNMYARILEETLKDFGIEAKIINVVRGPVITRFELTIAPGIKVNRITALSDDIALCMKAISVRVIAPIPGKAAIGIEVPNKTAALVYLKELLASPKYKGYHIPLFLGKDISGEPLIEDVTELPHLLIAGSTGSGKTVCINAIVMGLLFTKTPDQLKMLMIDPKRIELSQYNKLPHLICPIITEPKKAVIALNILVKEMEDRYKLFAKVGARDIIKFNNRNQKNDPQDEEIPANIPHIVVIVDELADLMMTASADIETNITRLAQLSRAVGVHLILATQRPSVNVITGIIKANFTARLSFKVSSKIDSRTILDSNGAEKLLGKGDLLFLPPKISKLIRAQGTLISDSDINKTVKFIFSQTGTEFDKKFLKLVDDAKLNENEFAAEEEEDDFYEQAVNFVISAGQASASMLQRKFRIGYNRASRIIDMMEQRGIVGPFNGSRVREILVNNKVSPP